MARLHYDIIIKIHIDLLKCKIRVILQVVIEPKSKGSLFVQQW